MKPVSIALLLFLALAGSAMAGPSSNNAAYPLSTCIVSGETLGAMGDPVVLEVEGRELRFCCNNCVATFKDDPEAWIEKIDAKIIETQAAIYPTENCVVSQAKYTGMGGPVDQVVGNRLVRLCCNNCVEKLAADEDGYLAKLDAAVVAAQGPSYEATTCPISGGALGSMGDPVELVFSGQLVKLCCSGCVDKFYANPHKAMAMLSPGEKDAGKKQAEDHSAHKH